jgi:dolichyl-phosphate-mannose-protein mannosyltransferase
MSDSSRLHRLRDRLMRQLSRPDFWMLLGILAIASFTRLWNLGAIGFRGDEAVYAGQAAVIAGDDEMKRYFVLISRGNSNFLLYQYVVALFYVIFGVGDVLAREVSAFFSILTVLVTYEIGRTLYGKTVGLIAALLLAVSSYAIFLGRLALLDSTMAFLFTLAILCLAEWLSSQNPRWLYAFAATAALAIDAKVTSVLVLIIFGVLLVLTRSRYLIPARTVPVCGLIFLAFLTPAFFHLSQHGPEFLNFLSQSIRRVSHVPWYYYVTTIAGYEGYLILFLWLVGFALAVVRRRTGDILLISSALVVILFLQVYPLKAFNYFLPVVPVFSVLAARAMAAAFTKLSFRPAWTGMAVFLLIAPSLFYVHRTMQIDSYAGMREAAFWLEQNTPANAGVMTISRGSAQSVLSFYGQRDAYPFGRFRLATVLPGGTIVNARLNPGSTPTDWVRLWPPKLVQAGTVSYLVFYTEAGDDPPEDPIVDSMTQRSFKAFIENYGGHLVHTVYRNHEPRVWIYQVSRLQPKPTVDFAVEKGNLKIDGQGFRLGSEVVLYYNNAQIGRAESDQRGAFSASFPLPVGVSPQDYLVAVDDAGNYASSTGHHVWGEVYSNGNEPTQQSEPPSSIVFPAGAVSRSDGSDVVAPGVAPCAECVGARIGPAWVGVK